MIGVVFTMAMILSMGIVIAMVILIDKKRKEVNQTKVEGITVNAVVVNSKRMYRYWDTTVQYTGNDGCVHEATVATSVRMALGKNVQIAYVPGQYEKIVMLTNPWKG